MLQTFNPILNKENDVLYVPDCIIEIKSRLKEIQTCFNLEKPLSESKKIAFLITLRSEFEKRKNEIEKIYSQESGLSKERFNSEFSRMIIQFKHFENHLQNRINVKTENIVDTTSKITFSKEFLPIGPVLVLGASNFPLAYSTAGGDSISALCAGCPVIIKAHPFHLGTSSLVAKIIENCLKKIKIPTWYFTHVIDHPDHRHVEFLLKSSEVKAVGFTGSKHIGIRLQSIVSSRIESIPFFAEMGSINPIIIDESSISEKNSSLALKLVKSINNDAGQFCTKPGLIFLPNNTKSENFIDLITQIWKEEPFYYALHPSILKNYNEKIYALHKAFPENLILNQIGVEKQHFDKNAFVFLLNKLTSHPIIFEEIFGPCTHFVLYDNIDSVIEIIHFMGRQLTGTYFGKEICEKVVEAFKKKCGRIIFNDVPTGVKVVKNMHHGGPFPASSDCRFTSVGNDSILRFLKPVTLQNF